MAAETATLADLFVVARNKSQPWSNMASKAARDMRRPQPPQQHQRTATVWVSSPQGKINLQVPKKLTKRHHYAIFVDKRPHQAHMLIKSVVFFATSNGEQEN